jgi:restriction system protein
MGRKRDERFFDEVRDILMVLPLWVGLAASATILVVSILFGTAMVASESTLAKMVGVLLGFLGAGTSLIVFMATLASYGSRLYRRVLLASKGGLFEVRHLSWQQFELLVGEALRRDGYTVIETGGGGADGGIDLIARRAGEKLIVQCKHWKSWSVGVKVVREMYGVMIDKNATGVLIVTSGRYTKDAHRFAEGKPIQLMDGPELELFLKTVKGDSTARPEQAASASPASPAFSPAESQPPRCPRCGSEMVVRVARKGANPGNRFLGCTQFPRCNGTRDYFP